VQTTTTSTSVSQTQHVGESIGKQCRGGEVIELASDLGGGKTTFVHGLAKGIGSTDHVASPTFTISRLYKGQKLELHHFDFYRLQDPGLMEYELHDVLGDHSAVVVIEWSNVIKHVLPKERLTIRLIPTGETTRQFEMEYPESLNYLVEDL
jgi:tRNA threonylcarbamoyladenosine biosynthesis protein TsaE